MSRQGVSPPMGAVVEIAETRNAGWGWRCWCCDITVFGLAGLEAAEQSRAHMVDRVHRQKMINYKGPVQ